VTDSILLLLNITVVNKHVLYAPVNYKTAVTRLTTTVCNKRPWTPSTVNSD